MDAEMIKLKKTTNHEDYLNKTQKSKASVHQQTTRFQDNELHKYIHTHKCF